MTTETISTDNTDKWDEEYAKEWWTFFTAWTLGMIVGIFPLAAIFLDIGAHTYISYSMGCAPAVGGIGLLLNLNKRFKQHVIQHPSRLVFSVCLGLVLPSLITLYIAYANTGLTAKPIAGLGGYQLGQPYTPADPLSEGESEWTDVTVIEQHPKTTVYIYTSDGTINKIIMAIDSTDRVGYKAIQEKLDDHMEQLYGTQRWIADNDVWFDGEKVIEVTGTIVTLRYPEQDPDDIKKHVSTQLLRNKLTDSLGE